MLWFAIDAREYVIRDPKSVALAHDIVEPAWGREQGRLGGQQGELGRRQGELGEQQRRASEIAMARLRSLAERAIASGEATPIEGD